MKTKTIAHFRTGIGNFVLFTPALRALASMDPSGQIDLCTDPDWVDYRKNNLCELWKKLPFIQNVYASIDELGDEYETWFWTDWTSGTAAIDKFSKRNHHPRILWDQDKVHESDYYFSIVRDFYGYKGWKPTQMVVPADQPILPSDGRIKIILCNGSFGHIAVFKKWPHFKDLANQIKMFFKDKVSLIKIGAREELSEATDYDIDFVNKLTLTETACVMKQADLMITTDTGNMHVADAIATPMIVLWGGSSLPKNKPYNSQCKIIHRGYSCQPCQITEGYRECGTSKCLADITTGEVMFVIRKFISEGTL